MIIGHRVAEPVATIDKAGFFVIGRDLAACLRSVMINSNGTSTSCCVMSLLWGKGVCAILCRPPMQQMETAMNAQVELIAPGDKGPLTMSSTEIAELVERATTA